MRKLKVIGAITLIIMILAGLMTGVSMLSKKAKEAKVITTIFPIYDMCREMLGSDDDIILLEDNGMDMHSFEPTASDIVSLSKASIFIYIGGESDKWVGSAIRSANNVNLKKLALLSVVNKLEESEDGVLESEEESEAEDEVEYDEHIWLSLNNAIRMASAIRDSLISVFPQRQELIRENANNYILKLESLEALYRSALYGKQKLMVVADRFPFLYLTNDYDINYVAAFQGCSAETEAKPQTITKLIDSVNINNLNYVCVLETSDQSIANKVVKDSGRDGIEIVVLNSCQNVSEDIIENTYYLDIMKYNLEVFKKVLN